MLFNFASLIKAQFCIFYALGRGFVQCREYFQKAKKDKYWKFSVKYVFLISQETNGRIMIPKTVLKSDL